MKKLILLLLFLGMATTGWGATFGQTGHDGYFDWNVYVDKIGLSKFTLSEDASVTSLTIRVKAASGTINVKGVIYDDDGAGAIAGTLEGTTAVTSVDTSTAEKTFTFDTPVSLTAGDYYIGYIAGGTGDYGVFWNTGHYWHDFTPAGAYATPPSTCPALNDHSGGDLSAYATYTANGSPTPTSNIIILN